MDPETHPPTGPQKPLDEAIAEYLMACEVESKSPRTVQAYSETLRVFRRVVGREDQRGGLVALGASGRSFFALSQGLPTPRACVS